MRRGRPARLTWRPSEQDPLAFSDVSTWEALVAFLGAMPSRRTKRTYPMDRALRAALPDAPGVYRFKRSKATAPRGAASAFGRPGLRPGGHPFELQDG